MNLKHVYQQPLIFATGLAALVHSTWSLGTMFSGEQPAVETITTAIGYIHFAGWIIPALLIAFALDVGQIITSHEIRTRGMTIARGMTFAVFSVATYYLQWLYIAHHMPLVELASGISSVHLAAAVQLRDFGLWAMPALLPAATLLYTFSSERDAPTHESNPVIQITEPESDLAQLPDTLTHIATCDDCGWQSDEKTTELGAKRALAAHQGLHCTKQVKLSENGVGKHEH